MSDCENLIVLSGGIIGHIWDVVQRNDLKTATTILKKWKEKLGNRYFLELTRTGRMQEEDHVQELLKLGIKEDVALVATNDVCFEDYDDYEAHEARVCINDGRTLDDPRRERFYSSEQYL